MSDHDEWNRLSALDANALRQLEQRIRIAAMPSLAAQRRRSRFIDLSLGALAAAAATFVAVELSSPHGTDQARWQTLVAPTDALAQQLIDSAAPPALPALLALYDAGTPAGSR